MRRSIIRKTAWAGLVGALALTGACATTPAPKSADSLGETLSRLQNARSSDNLGSVRGYVVFSQEVFTRFKNHPVSLIPLSADLEAAVTTIHDRYVAGRHAPLPRQTALEDFTLLERYVAAVNARGSNNLVLVVKTDPDEAQFEFTQVPAGRWLLVSRVVTAVSIVYWAIPIEVQPGQTIKQDLLETNIWIEGLLKNGAAGE